MIEILFWIFFGLVIAIIIGSFVIMLNPNLHGKMLSSQVKSLKYMMDDSKDTLKNLTDDMTDITKDSVEATARAVKKGLTEEDGVACLHCGKKIDKDSKYCKYCGARI